MNPITTAYKLKTFRNLKGLTPEQVAEKAQLNLNDYKNLEAGKKAVSVEKLEKVCDALGIDFKEWFDTDKSQVYVNNGEIKVEGGSRNIGNCENCYFYERGEEDTQVLETLATLANSLAEKLDDEILAKKIDQVLRKNLDNLENKK
jgi:transcriptional regulator with XRE-family HTH domain